MKTKFILPIVGASILFLTLASVATAQSWVLTSAPHLQWSGLASSADGNRLAAAIRAGLIYVSTNSGGDWTTTTAPNESWNSIASSADGTTLVAVGSAYVIMGDMEDLTFGLIYASTNSGASWIKASGAPTNVDWLTVASSADGTKQVAAGIFSSIYTSTNSGINWQPTSTPSGQWEAVASSADGNKLAGALAGGSIYVSTNAGSTWTKTGSPTGFWKSIASSSDGSKLIAANPGSMSIYASTDSGITWNLTGAPNEQWNSIVSSADGTKLAALALAIPNGPIYLSADSGATWTPTTAPNKDWSSIASSADGNKMVAAINIGDGIYTYQSTPIPSLNIAISGGKAVISWAAAGTNLVLQQNSDLRTTNWTQVLATSPATNSQSQIAIQLTPGNMFYRLLSQ